MFPPTSKVTIPTELSGGFTSILNDIFRASTFSGVTGSALDHHHDLFFCSCVSSSIGGFGFIVHNSPFQSIRLRLKSILRVLQFGFTHDSPSTTKDSALLDDLARKLGS